MRKLLLLSALTASVASPQALSVGVIGGAPFSDVVNNATVSGIQSVAKSSNFSIGPALRVNLPASLRLEVDALYRPYSFSLAGLGTSQNISANQFRFPVLLQYRFGAPVIKPFIEGGLSYDHLAGLTAAAKSLVSGPGALLHQSDAAVVLGVGADAKLPFVRISGELRFTRQTVSNFQSISNLNQAEVLFGLHF